MPDHPCKTPAEETLCSLLSKLDYGHSHGSLIFPVTIQGKGYSYIPDFIIHGAALDHKIAILELVLNLSPGSREISKVKAFREQHGKEYAVILITKESLIPRFANQAYDYIIPIEKLSALEDILQSMKRHIETKEEAI